MLHTPFFLPTSRPRGRDEVEFRHVGTDWVLFDPGTRRILALDVTEALVWSYCTGDIDVAAMMAEIRQVFGAALPQGKDTGVVGALTRFQEAGLLRGIG